MRNKKIIIGSAVIVFLCIIVIGIFIKKDLDNYIRVNSEYTYEEGWTFVVDNSEYDNVSMYNKIFNKNEANFGASIYAMNDVGYIEKIVDLYDSNVSDVVVVGDCLKILFYHIIDGEVDYYESLKVVEISLSSPQNYNIESYQNGEVLEFDKITGEEITREDTHVVDDCRSNILVMDNTNILVNGAELVIETNGRYENVCEFESAYNYVELLGGSIGVFAVCSENYSTQIKYVDLQDKTSKDCFKTSDDIIDMDVYDEELYILTESALLKLDNIGNVETVRTLDKSNCNRFDGMVLTETITIFGDGCFEEIRHSGVKTYTFSQNISVDFVVNKIEKDSSN